MPRPKSGLLSRMMRLSPAACMPGSPAEQPRFCIRPGAHYLVGIHVLNVPGASPAYDAWRLKLHSPLGQATTLPLTKAQPGNGISHASAEWDPSHLLPTLHAASDEASAVEAMQLVDLQAEIGLGKLEAPADPSDRWTMRIPVQVARIERYVPIAPILPELAPSEKVLTHIPYCVPVFGVQHIDERSQQTDGQHQKDGGRHHLTAVR